MQPGLRALCAKLRANEALSFAVYLALSLTRPIKYIGLDG